MEEELNYVCTTRRLIAMVQPDDRWRHGFEFEHASIIAESKRVEVQQLIHTFFQRYARGEIIDRRDDLGFASLFNRDAWKEFRLSLGVNLVVYNTKLKTRIAYAYDFLIDAVNVDEKIPRISLDLQGIPLALVGGSKVYDIPNRCLLFTLPMEVESVAFDENTIYGMYSGVLHIWDRSTMKLKDFCCHELYHKVKPVRVVRPGVLAWTISENGTNKLVQRRWDLYAEERKKMMIILCANTSTLISVFVQSFLIPHKIK